jgi:hypothetical protein
MKRKDKARNAQPQPLNGVELFKAMEGKTSGQWGKIGIRFVPDTRSQEEIVADRRDQLRRENLCKVPQGFSLVPNGRAGAIYFRRKEELIRLGTELSGSDRLDIIVFDDGLRYWIDVNTLDHSAVSSEEQQSIRTNIIDWLLKRGLKFSIGGQVVAQR